MKEHLINLLYEEYKLISFVNRLDKLGVYMDDAIIHNHKIVLDIIGFPEDNSWEYFKKHPEGTWSFDIENPSKEFFSRSWLSDRFYDLVDLLNHKEESIHKGQEMESQDDIVKHEVMIALADYVDWLYKEMERLEKIWNA